MDLLGVHSPVFLTKANLKKNTQKKKKASEQNPKFF